MSDRLRAHLRSELSKKVEAHGLVVWDDPDKEYGQDIAQEVCPTGTQLAVFAGSWYALRRSIEDELDADVPPRLVVYLDAAPPPSDPLAEVRLAAAKGRFSIRLRTLVRNALKGELTDSRLADIGRQARDLAEAEAALEGGDAADVRMIALLGTADTVQMALGVLAGEQDDTIEEAGAWSEVAAFLSHSVGGQYADGGDALRRAVTRHLVLTELTAHLGALPDGVKTTWSPPPAKARDQALKVLQAWRRDRHRIRSYAQLATAAENDLGLAGMLGWDEMLEGLDTVPAVESAVLDQAVRLLDANELPAALRLAERRLAESLWAREPLEPPLEGAAVWDARWRSVAAIARLRSAIAAHDPPAGSVADLLGWYVDQGWAVDREHRRLELSLVALQLEEQLEERIQNTREAYERWLDALLTRFTREAAAGIDPGRLLPQSHVHQRHVAKGEEPVAYLLVDALRYELGAELAEKLRVLCTTVDTHAAVAAVPSITLVGMANLCPGAERGLTVALDHRHRMEVRAGEEAVKNVSARLNLLRAAHGRIVDFQLADVVSRGEQELAKRIKGASLVVVRSQEIDAQGESGMLTVTWEGFETTIEQLARAVARLGQAGVRRVVISADHGFLALSRGLREDRLVDPPRDGGTGELHARAWVGHGGVTTDAVMRLPLSAAGVRSDLDLLTPAHLAVFRGPWKRHFAHGGVSPQELVVPVITATMAGGATPQGPTVRVEIAGGRLTTGVFSATIQTAEATLLSDRTQVRILVRRQDSGEPVARLVAGDEFDRATDTVNLGDEPAVLTFQLIANLAREETVEIAVADAQTDRVLGSATVRTVAPITVEDSLG